MAPKNSPLFFSLLLFIALDLAVISSAAADSPTFTVLVPNRTYFKEFVDCSDPSDIKGFSIDVFKNALSILISNFHYTNVTYTCFNYSDGGSYDAMINELSNQSQSRYTAVVGDVTISEARLDNASFTQSYLDSGIVVLALAASKSQHFPGVLFKPFTAKTWSVVGLSVVLTGVALWLLERNEHPQLGGGQSKSEQFKRAFWFATSILVFFKRESIKNPLAKFVMVAWILFILLLGSSYTASLSSILTVYELSTESKNLSTLARENATLIGYQVGSTVKDYLTGRYKINSSRLTPLNDTDDYARALRSGRVAAVVDEIPYISLFLAGQPASNCTFSVSSKLTIEGFGFAFYDSSLAAAFSVAILTLSENGELQKMQDGSKLSNFQCPSQVQSTQLDLKSSEGPFFFLALAMVACIGLCLYRSLLVRNSINNNRSTQQFPGFREPSFVRSMITRRVPSPHLLQLEDFY